MRIIDRIKKYIIDNFGPNDFSNIPDELKAEMPYYQELKMKMASTEK